MQIMSFLCVIVCVVVLFRYVQIKRISILLLDAQVLQIVLFWAPDHTGWDAVFYAAAPLNAHLAVVDLLRVLGDASDRRRPG